MENLSNWEIVGIIVLVLLFGGFILRVAARLFKFFLIAVLILAGIYFVKPELLNDWFGADTTTKIEQTVKEKAKPLAEELKKDVGEVLDSMENKL